MFLLTRSHQETLVKLKVVLERVEVIFLVDTGAARSSIIYQPKGTELSKKKK